MSDRLPELFELAPRIQKIGTICVMTGIAAFGIAKSYPFFRLFAEPTIATGAAAALGLSCAYLLFALDRYTDDYRERLHPADHLFFLLGASAVSVAIGVLSTVLPMS